MAIRNLVQQQLERLVRRYPWVRWPLIAVLVVLLIVFGRVDNRLPGPSGKGPSSDASELSGFAQVIDGDSLRVDGGEVRLKDIDAPEGRQTCTREGREWDCGEEARRTLQRLIGGQKVTCRSVERDKHDRYLGYCESGGRGLNAAMVASGFAVSYGGFRAEERDAKAKRLGVWSSQFQMPRDWRHERGIGQ